MCDKRKARRYREKHLLQSKLSPCLDCGAFNPAFMQWHHRDPLTKVGNVPDVYRRHGLKAALNEISKCDCLCANCHCIRHYSNSKKTHEIIS